LHADGFIVRAQATIRAGGFSPAQVFETLARRVCQLSIASELSKTCALRAPTAFSVRRKALRTENAVMVKSKDGAGFLTRS